MNGRIVTVAVERGELLTSTSYNQLSEAASFTEVYRRLVSLSLILLPTYSSWFFRQKRSRGDWIVDSSFLTKFLLTTAEKRNHISRVWQGSQFYYVGEPCFSLAAARSISGYTIGRKSQTAAAAASAFNPSFLWSQTARPIHDSREGGGGMLAISLSKKVDDIVCKSPWLFLFL